MHEIMQELTLAQYRNMHHLLVHAALVVYLSEDIVMDNCYMLISGDVMRQGRMMGTSPGMMGGNEMVGPGMMGGRMRGMG